MDTPEDNLQQIDDALDALPSEVKEFLYKGGFDSALISITTQYSLDQKQASDLRYHLMQVIILLEEFEVIDHLCDQWNLAPERKQSILETVQKTIILPIIDRTNYIVTDEFETGDEVQAPSPADILTSLKSRLTVPGAIAPSARELPPGPEKKTEAQAPAPVKRTIDPYRELPTA